MLDRIGARIDGDSDDDTGQDQSIQGNRNRQHSGPAALGANIAIAHRGSGDQ